MNVSQDINNDSGLCISIINSTSSLGADWNLYLEVRRYFYFSFPINSIILSAKDVFSYNQRTITNTVRNRAKLCKKRSIINIMIYQQLFYDSGFKYCSAGLLGIHIEGCLISTYATYKAALFDIRRGHESTTYPARHHDAQKIIFCLFNSVVKAVLICNTRIPEKLKN